jgi:hypothetical protein
MVAALIVFDQGGPGTPGQALEGTTSVLVTVTNDDDTDVTSWSIDLLDVPSDSALVPGNLGAAATGTPSASFTPDVPGAYRVGLTVSDGVDSNIDIRNFGVRNSRGIIVPPYQKLPDPLPLTGTGTPVDKPDELNFGGVSRGWAGTPGLGLLEQFIRTYDDLPRLDVSSSPVALAVDGPPLTVVDLDAVGASATVTLPDTPRDNQQVRILATGATVGRVATVQAAGGGTIEPDGTVDIPINGHGIFVHLGSNVWRALLLPLSEVLSAGGDAGGQNAVNLGAVSIGTTATVNGFYAVGGTNPETRLEETPGSYTSLLDGHFGSAFGQLRKAVSSGAARFDFDLTPGSGSDDAIYRFFRSTTTTGDRFIEVIVGDGTATVQHRVDAAGDVDLCLEGGSATIGSAGNDASLFFGSSGPEISQTYIDAAGQRVVNVASSDGFYFLDTVSPSDRDANIAILDGNSYDYQVAMPSDNEISRITWLVTIVDGSGEHCADYVAVYRRDGSSVLSVLGEKEGFAPPAGVTLAAGTSAGQAELTVDNASGDAILCSVSTIVIREDRTP